MTPTPHIGAKAGDFAKTVLMPGDPMRAKFIAENFLKEYKCVNTIRGMNGYTGFYNEERISVMASGMGQPSIGIYSYELYNFYDVENIIRIGTCGALHKDLRVKDIVVALGACTDGNFAKQYRLPGTFAPIADFGLAVLAADYCKNNNIKIKVGNILSTDYFYDDSNSGTEWAKMGVLCVEMETAALYCNALRAGKKALTVCSVSDSLVDEKEYIEPEEREKGLIDMIKLGLEIGIKA